MSDFVEQCRLEWKQLGVADPLSEEMAADLAADLDEAAADGVSAEELLGSSAFDPRSFAASWAAERGIVPPPAGRRPAVRRPFVLAAFTGLAVVALIVAALLLATGQPRVSLEQSKVVQPHFVVPDPGSVTVLPPAPTRHIVIASTSASAPVEWILLILALAALGFASWLWTNRGRTPPGAPAA